MEKKKTPALLGLGFGIGLTLAAVLLGMSGCGSPNSDVSSADTNYPYPNFKGGNVNGESNFATLINTYTEGKIAPTPWAGYWWPYTKNGISGPAAKYDAAHGHSTNAAGWEASHHGARVPKVQQWWGHCNGWTAASVLFPEPEKEITANGVYFDVGDIKGLLAEAGMAANADFFGERIDVDDPTSPKYWDTVPDQYFLVLTNYIGRLKQGVLFDRYTGAQVWNQPLAGYKFDYPKPEDYLGADPSAPNVYRIIVNSTIWWLDDGVAPDFHPTPDFEYADDPSGVIQSRQLSMEVWLDGPVVFDSTGKITSSGNVIVTRDGDYLKGGAWRMGEGYMIDAWPDYMWIPYSITLPDDPNEDYVNPYIDVDWLRKHLVNPDPNAPNDDRPSPGSSPGMPHDFPTFEPVPVPTETPTGHPTDSPTGTPTGTPTGSPTNGPDWPFPFPFPFPLPSHH